MIIAPVLVEVCRSLDHQVGLFSGVERDVDAVYGAVTTGDNWRFLKLAGAHLTLDADAYMRTRSANRVVSS